MREGGGPSQNQARTKPEQKEKDKEEKGETEEKEKTEENVENVNTARSTRTHRYSAAKTLRRTGAYGLPVCMAAKSSTGPAQTPSSSSTSSCTTNQGSATVWFRTTAAEAFRRLLLDSERQVVARMCD